MPDAEEVMTTFVGTPAPPALDRHGTFAALFDAHYPAVLAYCRRRAAFEEAGDAALATFEVLWRTIDETPVRTLPWLYRVAAGQLANGRRSERRRLRLVERLARRPAEAAAVLGVTPATFAVRLHRARRRLDALLTTSALPAHPVKDAP